jgi:hypothetical protein
MPPDNHTEVTDVFPSLLPSEGGGGIRGMAMFPHAQEGSPLGCQFRHPGYFSPALPVCDFDIC